MSRRTLSSYLLLTILASTSNASLVSINLLSQQYHISGNYWCQVGSNLWNDAYDMQTGEPVTCEISSQDSSYLGLAYSSTNQFSVHVAATSRTPDEGDASAMAEAVWTFCPKTEILEVTLKLDYWGKIASGSLDEGAKIILTDLTTGEELLYEEFTSSMPAWYSPSELTQEFNVNFTHDYGLYMFANTSANGDCSYIDIKAEILPLPEPSTVFFLISGSIFLIPFKNIYPKRQR